MAGGAGCPHPAHGAVAALPYPNRQAESSPQEEAVAERVGFIGLGAMGTPMAWNVHGGGYELGVFNRTPAKTRPFADEGVTVFSTPAILTAESDVVVIMVTSSEALDTVLYGDAGVLAGLGRGKAVVNMGTVSPEATREAAEAVHAMGGRFIDAPVSGTVKPAEEGNLVVLAGGLAEDVERVRPVLEAMGKAVVPCGDIPQGTHMKLVLNLMLGNLMQSLAEGLNLGRALELDPDQMLEAIDGGPLGAPLFRMKGGNILAGNFAKQFPVDLLAKDLDLVTGAAGKAAVPLPQTAATRETVSAARALGHGDEDMAALIRVLERLTGSEVRS
ncbi:NAD(P)-dependent oxidoreductase [Thiohalorhabdus denitrificans]|uniref:NAD(P)-dependent oxidoreductase n=1 Tax=Thiohalorhabdus denitrificans TaxID=381306 RepID=UPI0022B208F9|nr:NAD(P)-dependent oxidoreductase [Thiohalorhabdus denitrificans]